eukprot:COSAG03_NODE_16875_length_390_cov_0.670103_1_plen_109_part_10
MLPSSILRSYIGSKEGPLPSGSQTWQDFQSGKFVDEQLSVTILTTEADMNAADRRCRDEIAATMAAKAARALAQLSVGFTLMGHPELSFNGLYRKVSEHKGWPVLKNAS